MTQKIRLSTHAAIICQLQKDFAAHSTEFVGNNPLETIKRNHPNLSNRKISGK